MTNKDIPAWMLKYFKKADIIKMMTGGISNITNSVECRKFYGIRPREEKLKTLNKEIE